MEPKVAESLDAAYENVRRFHAAQEWTWVKLQSLNVGSGTMWSGSLALNCLKFAMTSPQQNILQDDVHSCAEKTTSARRDHAWCWAGAQEEEFRKALAGLSFDLTIEIVLCHTFAWNSFSNCEVGMHRTCKKHQQKRYDDDDDTHTHI